MRRIAAQLLSLLFLFALFGCSQDGNEQYIPSFQSPAALEVTSMPTETAPASAAAQTVPSDSSFEIHFIDVGQADSALILCDGEAALIDGGNAADSSLIYAYLESHGVTRLSALVASHAHEDHIGGLNGALAYASVDTVYCPVTDHDSRTFEKFLSQLAKQGAEITVPSPGDVFHIGSASATVIGPLSPSDEPNNTSIVLLIQYGNTRFLFTGDAELDEETEILDAGYDISCDVLKVGHHGSDTSTGYRWLRAAAPKYAVISVGSGNEYGHPTQGTLSKLRDAEVTVLRTDLQGHIICTSDGKNIAFQTERNSDINTLDGAGPGSHSAAESESSQIIDGSIAFVVNTNSGKFHIPSCSSVSDITSHNRLDVSASREELIEQGYSPCGRCQP